MKDRISEIVEEKRMKARGAWLDNNDENSKSIRRVVTVNAVGQAWRELRERSNISLKRSSYG